MPSPFPGMDPFVEMQEWEDFHVTFNVTMSDQLGEKVEPRYVVRVQRREFECDGRRETYVVIRERETLEVVTVIETLSPANKRTASDGRQQYLEKRGETLSSHSNLVELDLLRGGMRLPVVGLPATDYCALVSRARRRPKVSIYPWSIRPALPPISIPLRSEDPDVTLDLQSAFATVYDRARYQLSLDYSAQLEPPLSAEDAAWAKTLGRGEQRIGVRPA